MPVYDLDKTQQWLDRTLAISKTPPVRGGVKTDHRTRRQTFVGVALVLGVILVLAFWPRPSAIVKADTPLSRLKVPVPQSAEVAAVVVPEPAKPRPAVTSDSRRRVWNQRQRPSRFGAAAQPASGFRGSTVHRGETKVAPHAPIWLDGM